MPGSAAAIAAAYPGGARGMPQPDGTRKPKQEPKPKAIKTEPKLESWSSKAAPAPTKPAGSDEAFIGQIGEMAERNEAAEPGACAPEALGSGALVREKR